MRFLIIAIDHGWQLVPQGIESPESTAAKGKFEGVLTGAIDNALVDLICEESDPCYLSIAQKIAYEHKRIPWKNITMTAQERLEAAIWEALLHRPGHAIEESPGCHRTVDHRIPEDEIREQFFVKETIQAAKDTAAKSIVILCGDMHAGNLKRILEECGHQVEVNHDLIPQKYWE